jgi:RNA polymerase sigma-70 factor, ECF subfamily
MRLPWPTSYRDPDRASYSYLLGCSDEQIIREMQCGNNDAFAVVFQRYHRLIHVTASRILGDDAEAEDLTQSVFLEIHRKVEQFNAARGTLKVWLLQFAYSRSISRRNYLQTRGISHAAASGDSRQVSIIAWPMRAPTQETTLLTEQILRVLPEPQRETIAMFFFKGLTLKEIAAQRQETVSNVRHHYYRGLKRLRVIFKGSG